MPLAIFSNADVALLDRQLTAACKSAWGLSRAVPTGLIHEDTQWGGVGFPSVLTEYVHAAGNCLVRALNDTGRLGAVTTSYIHLSETQPRHPPGRHPS